MYVCAYRPGGQPLTRAELFGAIARMRAATSGELDYLIAGPFAAVVARSPLRARMARRETAAAVGDVRLDNRAELMSLLRHPLESSASDIDIVLALIDEQGDRAISRIVGDYSFVYWDARAQKVLAVRDAFGVKPLFVREADDVVLFSSAVAPLQSTERLDAEFVADFLVGAHGQGERTLWSDVRAVPAAHFARQQGTVRSLRRHWDPADIEPVAMTDADAVEQFRTLFDEAVTNRMEPGATWAQLSGGLDSSSIAATAAALRGPDALAGTLTLVDTMGEGDERRYSDAVAARWGLRNEQLSDFWPWQYDGTDAPLTDQPSPLYPFYARDRRVYGLARESGARVVLSGLGADHYLAPTLDYITDMAAQGSPRAAVRELTEWSVVLRQSFWSLSRQQLVDPFLPARMRGARTLYDIPSWVRPEFAARYRMHSRMQFNDSYLGRPGQRVRTQTLANLSSLQGWFERWPWGEDVELRYPFLHRPLVEAALAMPVSARIKPGMQKWVLRAAVGDRLPEVVRTRRTKGGIDSRILWALQHEQACIDELLSDSSLAAINAVDVDALRSDVDSARRGRTRNNVYLMSALALETWMSVRAGRPLTARRAAQSAA
jgi:asparagine synthase (glutamine-hydrolysing)